MERGELELEEHGAVYSGPGEDEHLRQTHELEGVYGLTDRFEVILEGVFEDPIGDDFKAEEIELGGQYELIEREGDGFGLGFRTLYEFALEGDSPDEILFGPVAKLAMGHTSAALNTFLVGQVGDEAEIDSLELKVNWRLQQDLNERWGIGVEGYSEIEDLSHPGSFDDQAHRVGPVAYLKLGEHEEREALSAHAAQEGEEHEGPEWKLAAGALFGVSDAVSDVTFKFDIEAEF